MEITREKFVKEWVKDLRSGKFVQSRNELSTELSKDGKCKYGYCCLGVACETGQRLGIIGANWNNGQLRTSELPGIWFETIVGRRNPDVSDDKGIKRDLVYLNDIVKMNFNAIADMIERQFLTKS